MFNFLFNGGDNVDTTPQRNRHDHQSYRTDTRNLSELRLQSRLRFNHSVSGNLGQVHQTDSKVRQKLSLS